MDDAPTHFAEMPLYDSPWAKASIHNPDEVERFIHTYKDDASRIVHLLTDADPRTADPFVEGSYQKMKRFRMASRGHAVTSSSNCRFAEMKNEETPTSFFLIADANAMEAQGPIIEIIQWCMTQELKRHENKHVKVYLLADETSNFKIHDLSGLITYARGYGLRLHLYLQNFSAFRTTYNQETLATVLSEAEIQQFLPGIREDEVLQFIERKQGQVSIIVRKRRRRSDGGIETVDYSEEGRAALTADEIRRLDQAIVFIRRRKPVLTDVPKYAEVDPWRNEVDPDPFHGNKPFLLPVRYWLGHPFLSVLRRFCNSLWPFNRKGK